MQRYSVAGRSTATAATTNLSGGHLWNPSSTRVIYIMEMWFYKTVATRDDWIIQRTTTIGVGPSSTVTPDIDNDWERLVAPPAGPVLYTGTFATTEPTPQTPAMDKGVNPAAIGAGFALVFTRPRKVVGSEGLGIQTPVSTALQPYDLTYVWDE